MPTASARRTGTGSATRPREGVVARSRPWQCYNVAPNVPSLLRPPDRRRAAGAVPATPVAVADGPAAEVAPTEATTVRILDAALDELLEFGTRRASLEDVARRAGVARITIYRRFPTKDDLIRAVVLREGRRVFAAVDAVVAELSDLDDQLVEGFAAILDAVRSHPLLQRLLVTETDQTITSLTTQGGAVVALGREYLAGHLLSAQRAGRLADVDVRAVAEILVRLTLSFLLTPDSCIPLATPDEARRFARRFVVPAVSPASARAARP